MTKVWVGSESIGDHRLEKVCQDDEKIGREGLPGEGHFYS